MKSKINIFFFLFALLLLNSSFSFCQNRYSNVPDIPAYQGVNTDLLLQIGQIKDQQIQAEIDAQHQDMLTKIQGLRNWYNNQSVHATPTDKTWVEATGTDNNNFCFSMVIYTENGYATKYRTSDKEELNFYKTGSIYQGRATVQLMLDGDIFFVDLYF